MTMWLPCHALQQALGPVPPAEDRVRGVAFSPPLHSLPHRCLCPHFPQHSLGEVPQQAPGGLPSGQRPISVFLLINIELSCPGRIPGAPVTLFVLASHGSPCTIAGYTRTLPWRLVTSCTHGPGGQPVWGTSRYLRSLPAEAPPQTSLPGMLWELWFVSCVDATRWGVKESPE